MSKNHQNHRAILENYIRENSIFNSAEDTTMISHSGGKLKWIMDLRPVFLNPEMLGIVTDIFWDKYQNQLPFQIAGMEVAAIPLVIALIIKGKERGLDTNGLLIRKERKTTGLGKNIEGAITDAPVILVDDLMNSGGSLDKCRAVLEQENCTIKSVFVLIDYESPHGIYWREQNKIEVNSVLKLSTFDLAIEPSKKAPPTIDYEIQWRFYEKGAFPYHTVPKSTPLLVGDYIYMGTESAKMVCINRHNGDKVWEFPIKMRHNKGIWSSPAHHNGRIYFGAYNGNIYCLDAKTGQEIWKNPACEFVGSSPLIVPENNMLYIGLEYQRPREMGSNAALDLDTGERIWETGQKKYQHGSATYYAAKDWVIFGNADHDVSAYEAKTGKLVWKSETERSHKYPPAVDHEREQVVSTSFDGNIYIFDINTGKRRAAIQTDEICYTTPLITHDKIFAGSGDRHLYIIDAKTFELLEKFQCNARVYSSPRLVDGNVVFGTNGGTIFEIDPETHDVKGRCQLPDAIPNAISASPDNKYLYAATHMNEIYGIERKP